ncbi:hypothetical protein Ppa05_34230 [Planomonospora parontospora subsp. antibiotica]|nr:hypothetical protein Ppa05_34230 [Planomonospora parontospora subsp. antibiotica]
MGGETPQMVDCLAPVSRHPDHPRQALVALFPAGCGLEGRTAIGFVPRKEGGTVDYLRNPPVFRAETTGKGTVVHRSDYSAVRPR